MKVAFHTLGCKVNQYESEAMAQMFRGRGWEIVGERDFADAYVINTCTVTAIADKKSRQYIRRMKRVNPDSVIAVTGCYAQISPDEVAGIQGVDIITGTNEKHTLIDYVEELAVRKAEQKAEQKAERKAVQKAEQKEAHHAAAGGSAEDVQCIIHPYEELGVFEEMGIVSSTENRTRAFIKIQEGCNRFCSYCVIPYARGPVRSRALEDIVEEAKSLIAAGYKELVLTGINTAQYDMEGRDLYADSSAGSNRAGDSSGTERTASETADSGAAAEPFGVEKAIAAINALPGEFRIRLSSLEPAVVNADYVKRLFRYEKLCHHLHMSAQSGSDAILQAMNRPYDAGQYMEMAKAVCEFDPCFGLSTDIIVGFPGEKDSDFEDSCKLVARCAFCKTHIFKYSKRPMTKAAEMKGQVSPQVKQKRSERLQSIAAQAARAFFKMNIELAEQGRTEQVLFEEVVQATEEGAGIVKGDALLTGYTGNYIRVYVKAGNVKASNVKSGSMGEEQLGGFRKVRLEEIYSDGIAASVVE